jgi:hypothetical protein
MKDLTLAAAGSGIFSIGAEHNCGAGICRRTSAAVDGIISIGVQNDCGVGICGTILAVGDDIVSFSAENDCSVGLCGRTPAAGDGIVSFEAENDCGVGICVRHSIAGVSGPATSCTDIVVVRKGWSAFISISFSITYSCWTLEVIAGGISVPNTVGSLCSPTTSAFGGVVDGFSRLFREREVGRCMDFVMPLGAEAC